MSCAKDHTEIECRFLEVNKSELIKKLWSLGAKDQGEAVLEETIMYARNSDWQKSQTFVRLRKSGDSLVVSYKEHNKASVDGTLEIEFGVDDIRSAEHLFEKLGLESSRRQQKLRHTFTLASAVGEVTVDIDTWPRIPTYVELEGDSEHALKDAARKLGLDWKDVVFENAGQIIEERYHVPIRRMKWFTFDRFE